MGQVLGLLVVANGAPIIARDLLGKRGDWPLDFATGAYVGLLAMMGDLLSSFLQRRLGIASSDSALGLDQGLEALVPVLVMQKPWALSLPDMLAIIAIFVNVDVVLSRLSYRLHIRQSPW
jgi:CDP-2,3-bis-(O-geranylgeranyl)-sn-glycerol synthase